VKNYLTGVQQGLAEVRSDLTEAQKDIKEVITEIHVIKETVNRMEIFQKELLLQYIYSS
jgi:hypothetical protein